MSSQAAYGIAQHRFEFGFYRQVWWNWLIGSAFFFGEIGAGLFLISLVTGYWPGILIGFLIVMVGKNMAHLKYLGRPARFWRAAMRPDRSWIARGIWATGLMGITGFIILLPHFAGTQWEVGGLAGRLVWTLAALSSLFIMFYDGFVMSFSPAIPFWHSRMLPVLCLTYAALGGTTLSLIIRELQGETNHHASVLMMGEYALIVLNFLLLLFYMRRMSHWTPAARETANLLLKGPYARAFIGLVLIVGLGATLVLSLVHRQFHVTWLVILVGLSELTGDFALLMVLLKSGLYAPQAAPRYRAV